MGLYSALDELKIKRANGAPSSDKVKQSETEALVARSLLLARKTAGKALGLLNYRKEH